jgi:lantibiotic modifying enzyme
LVADLQAHATLLVSEMAAKGDTRVPSVDTLLREHPSLAAAIRARLLAFVDRVAVLLSRLRSDKARVADAFGLKGELASPNRVELSGSRVSRGGFSTAVVIFDRGVRLVYKPRSGSTERCFAALLQWLETGLSCSPSRAVRVLEGEGYHWSEWVADRGPALESEQERFAARLGRLLFLSHLLLARDLHGGNLRADGEHPVLVDLETILHPYSPSLVGAGRPPGTVERVGAMLSLALGTGLLARRGWSARIARQQTGALADGFSQAYRLVLSCRDRFPISLVDGVSSRFFLRITAFYEATLRAWLDAVCAGREVEEDATEALRPMYVALGDDPRYTPLLAAEVRALARFEAPTFLAEVAGVDLLTPDGDRISSVLEESGLDQLRRRLAGLCEEDLARQCQAIAVALNGS